MFRKSENINIHYKYLKKLNKFDNRISMTNTAVDHVKIFILNLNQPITFVCQ